jgi:hypothetical protein
MEAERKEEMERQISSLASKMEVNQADLKANMKTDK